MNAKIDPFLKRQLTIARDLSDEDFMNLKFEGAIAPNRLNHCTATNVTFNDNKEISFSTACKEAAIS